MAPIDAMNRGQRKRHCRNRRAHQDKGHPPPDRCAQPVRERSDVGLNDQRGNVVERHDKADDVRLKMKTLLQKDGHEGVVHCPQHADAKETEAK